MLKSNILILYTCSYGKDDMFLGIVGVWILVPMLHRSDYTIQKQIIRRVLLMSSQYYQIEFFEHLDNYYKDFEGHNCFEHPEGDECSNKRSKCTQIGFKTKNYMIVAYAALPVLFFSLIFLNYRAINTSIRQMVSP
ncbi:hypothetical protein DMENIID0001_069930 [Sergentomyia squamirostris]